MGHSMRRIMAMEGRNKHMKRRISQSKKRRLEEKVPKRCKLFVPRRRKHSTLR